MNKKENFDTKIEEITTLAEEGPRCPAKVVKTLAPIAKEVVKNLLDLRDEANEGNPDSEGIGKLFDKAMREALLIHAYFAKSRRR